MCITVTPVTTPHLKHAFAMLAEKFERYVLLAQLLNDGKQVIDTGANHRLAAAI